MGRNAVSHLDFSKKGFQTSLYVTSEKICPVMVVNYLTIIRCQGMVEMTQRALR